MQKTLLTINIVLLIFTMLVVGCRKVEEPPIPVGKPLPYTSTAKPTQSMLQLLDSLPQTTIYKAAWQRADLKTYIDSLRGNYRLSPFTLFIPTDSAFNKAGYTINTVSTSPVAELDSLLRYLALANIITYDTMPLALGSTTYYPLMYLNPAFVGPPGFSNAPYQYKLTVGAYNNTLYLNGRSVGPHTTPIRATDGSIFLIDSVVSIPIPLTIAAILQADTSYSFYLAACHISDSIYIYQNIYDFPYDDTSFLYLNNMGGTGQDGWAEVFAPDNNAFRKAGFSSIADIQYYINNSAIAQESYYAYPFINMITNMDSILVNHRLISDEGTSRVDPGRSYVYTVDMRYNPGMQAENNGPAMGAIFFQNNGGQVVIHRQDFPGGRAAHVISPYDVTTLTGVLHRVDNLLLPTP